jgi:hypothetical protein
MKKTISILAVASCILAGQVKADNVYLPTVAYRDNGRQKTVYEYNNDGYIVSGKFYLKQGESEEYSLMASEIRGFHKLSNGEFVQTKTEMDSYRKTSAYDSNDMQLWEQTESFVEGQWVLTSRTETVLDGNGVRTGIRRYNSETQQYETVPGLTFDNKGRVVRYEFNSGENGDIPSVYECTWGSGRLYTGYSYTSGAQSMVYQNIVSVHNEQYFNPYELPIGREDADVMGIPDILLQPAYTDYEMHHVFYSGEMVYMGNTYVQTIVQDNANNEISEVVKLGNTEIQKNTYKQLANGGWLHTFHENGVISEQSTKEYDSHGVLTLYYQSDKSDNGGNYQYKQIYAIEYDTQGRPTKCKATSTNGEDEIYNLGEETYDTWVVKGKTGIAEMAAPKLSVYVSDGKLVITGGNLQKNAAISIYNLSGQIVGNSTDISHLPKGVYLVKVGDYIEKFIKQ